MHLIINGTRLLRPPALSTDDPLVTTAGTPPAVWGADLLTHPSLSLWASWNADSFGQLLIATEGERERGGGGGGVGGV